MTFCNLSKSDKWLNINGFIDPCDINYDMHLERDSVGKIIPLTKNGKKLLQNKKN